MATASRRFWQIHLSTALMSTLLAGVLLGVNLVERDIKSEYQVWYAKEYRVLSTWGWPCRFGRLEETMRGEKYVDWYDDIDRQKAALINFAACGTLTLAFMATCEFIIRRELARRARRFEKLAAQAAS